MTQGESGGAKVRDGAVGAVILAAIVLVTALCFRDAFTADFIFFDDGLVVTKNPRVRGGLSLDSVRWALTGVHAANWMPLTWMSHQLDWSLFGEDPRGHHAVSVGLHALTAGVLARALSRLTGRPGPAVVVSLLVALHPMRAESVVWVAERKDVLSALFFVGALLSWARWREHRRRVDRVLVAVCVAAGLASKSMLVTVPAVLLLVDLWLDGRRPDLRRLADALPELALAMVTGVIMLAIQDGTSVHAAEPLSTRLATAVVATWRAVELTVWPAGLSVFHPALREGPPPGLVASAIAGLGSVTLLGAALWARGQRAPLVGWLWFLGMFAPVSGIVPIGAHAFAERYTYLPHVGLFIAIVWGLDDVIGRRWRGAKGVVAAVVVVLCFIRTGEVVLTWHSSRTLAAAGLRAEPSNPVLLPIVAASFAAEGAFGPAIERYEHVIAARRVFLTTASPDVDLARLGIAWLEAGALDVAVDRFVDALTLKPDSAIAHRGLSIALFRRGDIGAGLAEARLAVRDGHNDVDNHRNLMSLLVAAGLGEEALAVTSAAPGPIQRDLAAMAVRVSFLGGGCRAALTDADRRLAGDTLLPRAFFEERALAMACVDPGRPVDLRGPPASRAGLLALLIGALHEGRIDDAAVLEDRFRRAAPQPGLDDGVLAQAGDGPARLAHIRAVIDRKVP